MTSRIITIKACLTKNGNLNAFCEGQTEIMFGLLWRVWGSWYYLDFKMGLHFTVYLYYIQRLKTDISNISKAIDLEFKYVINE